MIGCSPSEYEFCTAPLNPPRTGSDEGSVGYFNLPDDLYTSTDWVLVQVVSSVSGGGSYPSTSASEGGSHGVSSTVMGVFARRRKAPWSLDGKCWYCGRPAKWRLTRADGSSQIRCTNCVGLTFAYMDRPDGTETPEMKGWKPLEGGQ